ncbi:MAG: hypothetical protein KJ622_18180 [Alphaproteobacteria bacterium]|nr:hypothetical protein [Alphaproteobacteria bacterium]
MLIVRKAAASVWPRWDRQSGAVARPGIFATAIRCFAVAAIGIWVAAAQEDPVDTERDAAIRAPEELAAARTAPPTKEMMVAFYGGAPYTYPSRVTLKKEGVHDFAVEPVEWRGEPFNDPIYYGVRIVNWFASGRTGAMLDFTHSKTIGELDKEAGFEGLINGEPAPEKARIGDIFRRLEASHGHNMLTLNGLLRLFDLNPRLSLYGGLGAGINLPHSEIQLMKGGGRTYEYLYTGPAAQALIGVEFRIPRMSYFLEYKFTFAHYDVPLSELDGTKIGLFADLFRQAQRWWSGEPPPGGLLSKQLISHQAIGGLGVRFGASAAPTPVK